MTKQGRLGISQNLKPLLAVVLGLVGLVMSAGLAPRTLQAQTPPARLPALINAQEIQYDEELGVVVARGRVEIAHDNRIVIADQVSYNTNNDLVTANGNVSLLEPTGDVIFADYAELTADLKEAFIRDVKVLLAADKSRLVGATGQMLRTGQSVLRKGVYSPCRICEKDPNPLWQIRANKIIHNKSAQTITYHDARLELFGLPVAYTPWLETPDPTVKRKSGFLAPSYRSTTKPNGQAVEIPYFWAIDESSDLTLTPLLTTRNGLVAAGRYQRLLNTGDLSVDASATYGDKTGHSGIKKAFRGYVNIAGSFEIDETWRWGGNIQRVSDPDYPTHYGLGSASATSQLFIEGFRDRNFARLDSYKFQRFKGRGNDRELPLIAPRLRYAFQSEPTAMGLTTRFDSTLTQLSRREGRNRTQFSTLTGLELPYTGPLGDSYKITTQLQADASYTRDFVPGLPAVNPQATHPDQRRKSKVGGRLFPNMAIEWRYPFVSMAGNFSQTIEPIVQVVAAPDSSGWDKIPNDDSGDFEFDYTSIFALNRFSGRDLVDPGTRANYGFKWGGATKRGDSLDFMVAQSYRFSENTFFDRISGINHDQSDYVGHLGVGTAENITMSYGFRVDREGKKFKSSALSLSGGPKALRANLNYHYTQDINLENGQDVNRTGIGARLTSQLTEFWSSSASVTRNFKTRETTGSTFNITYQDECLTIVTSATRNFLRHTKNETFYTVQFILKHLGEVQTLTHHDREKKR